MAFQLTIAEGKEAGKEFVFTQVQVVIGRTADCDVILYDPGVSRKHARIFAQGTAYYVEDMGSSNGTKVNGSVVKKKQLSDGDAVALGPVVFNFSDRVVEDQKTDPRAALPVAKASTRIVSQDNIEVSSKGKETARGRAVALLPDGASESDARALARKNTDPMEPRKKASMSLARAEPRRSDRSLERAPRSEAGSKAPVLAASERARIRRESKGMSANLRIFWLEASGFTRAILYLFGMGIALGCLAGLYVLAVKEPEKERPQYPEPTKVGAQPVQDSFGLGPEVTWSRPDMKVFDFEFTAPTRAVVIIHFQAKDVSARDEVAVTVNGLDVGFIAPDAVNAVERTHEIIVAADVLKKGEMNQLMFDNTRNPPEKDPWQIWNVWIETALLPEIPNEQLRREAQSAFDRGVQLFARKDVGASNRYEAWRAFHNAWLNLEAHPLPRPELHRLAFDKMKEAQQELDVTCAKLMLEIEGFINQKDWASARSQLDYVKTYFPGNDQPCPFTAEAKRQQHNL